MQIPAPNYTQSPNVIFDYWMSRLNGTEFKVLCVLCRKIFGFHKELLRDRISISQMEKMTGVTRQALKIAVEKLELLGICKKYVGGSNGQQITVYELVVSNNSDPGENHTGKDNLTPLRRPREIQKSLTPVKITDTKERNGKKETFRAREAKPKETESEPAQQEKKYKQPNKVIPEFIKIKGIPPEDWQKLANQFADGVLFEALEDAKSFSKKIGRIDNKAAWITDRCKKIINKRKESGL